MSHGPWCLISQCKPQRTKLNPTFKPASQLQCLKILDRSLAALQCLRDALRILLRFRVRAQSIRKSEALERPGGEITRAASQPSGSDCTAVYSITENDLDFDISTWPWTYKRQMATIYPNVTADVQAQKLVALTERVCIEQQPTKQAPRTGVVIPLPGRVRYATAMGWRWQQYTAITFTDEAFWSLRLLRKDLGRDSLGPKTRHYYVVSNAPASLRYRLYFCSVHRKSRGSKPCPAITASAA